MDTIKVGDILYGSYIYNSRHNYYLLVTRRTAKTVDLVRITRQIVTHDGYGQNGTDRPAIVSGTPVVADDAQTWKGKRVKVTQDGLSEMVKFEEYVSSARKWDGETAYDFYTD